MSGGERSRGEVGSGVDSAIFPWGHSWPHVPHNEFPGFDGASSGQGPWNLSLPQSSQPPPGHPGGVRAKGALHTGAVKPYPNAHSAACSLWPGEQVSPALLDCSSVSPRDPWLLPTASPVSSLPL